MLGTCYMNTAQGKLEDSDNVNKQRKILRGSDSMSCLMSRSCLEQILNNIGQILTKFNQLTATTCVNNQYDVI